MANGKEKDVGTTDTPQNAGGENPYDASTPTAPKRAGSSTRGRASARPRYAGRRSARERDALASLAAQQKAEEAKVAPAPSAPERKADRGGRGGQRGTEGRGDRGHGRTRGRGGFMGEHLIASGPFGSGQVSAEVNEAYRRTASSRPGGGSGGSGKAGAEGSGAFGSGAGSSTGSASRPAGSKSTSSSKTEGGAANASGHGSVQIKSEDGGYISTDEEAAVEGVRVDIDHLQTYLVDLTTGGDGFDEMLAPVRLPRVAHQTRNHSSVFTNDTGEREKHPTDMSFTEKKRGKQRARDIEITMTQTHARPTAYSSSSETEPEMAIKEEAVDDVSLPDLPDADAELGQAQDTNEQANVPKDPPSSPESKRKAKALAKSSADDADDELEHLPLKKPILHGAAEEREWRILTDDRRMVFDELGRQPRDTTVPEPDQAEGHMSRAQLAQRQRDDNVYLFQFPGILPVLEAEGGEAKDASTEEAAAVKPNAVPANDTARTKQTEQPSNSKAEPKIPSGFVGKLRVHQSGKAYLDYGGFLMQVNMGMVKTFPEQVLVADLPPDPKQPAAAGSATGTRDEPDIKMEEAAEVSEQQRRQQYADQSEGFVSIGHVRGEFVVTPDLDELLKGLGGGR